MHTYIIAEIGQNHNGDMELAKKLIDVAAMPIYDFFTAERLPGVDAVKFTKRDLDEELTHDVAMQPYNSPHSFGATYYEHRKALEFNFEQHHELEIYAHEKGLEFVETLCSPRCVDMLESVNVDRVKIASRDVTNIPLLERLADIDKPVIISTGMCTFEELRQALCILRRNKKKIAILHCISEYPANYDNLNLSSIGYLKNEFPDCEIGYSDHSIGIVMPPVAVALGASVIEKHITLSRNMKGTDHSGSTEPEGVWRFVRDIRNVEIALGTAKKELSPNVLKTRSKLARSLATRTAIYKGQVVTSEHLCMLSPGTGLPFEQSLQIIGRRALRDIPEMTLVDPKDFE